MRQGLAAVEIRTTVLGHTQRGAKPTAEARSLAAQVGVFAYDELVREIEQGRGASGIGAAPGLVCIRMNGELTLEPIDGDMRAHDAERLLRIAAMVERLSY